MKKKHPYLSREQGEEKEVRIEKDREFTKGAFAETAKGCFKARPKRENGCGNHKQMESLTHLQCPVLQDLHRSCRDNG